MEAQPENQVPADREDDPVLDQDTPNEKPASETGDLTGTNHDETEKGENMATES